MRGWGRWELIAGQKGNASALLLLGLSLKHVASRGCARERRATSDKGLGAFGALVRSTEEPKATQPIMY